MKVTGGLILPLVWWGILYSSAILSSAHRYNYPTIKLNDFNGGSYATFLSRLRQNAIERKPELSHHIKVLLPKKDLKDETRFLLAEIGRPGREVTFALDNLNLYVVAFGVGGSSYFFTDGDVAVAKKNLFDYQKPNTQKDMGGGSYVDLERAAKKGRTSLNLGLMQLEKAVEDLRKNPEGGSGGKTEKRAESMLVVVQMVAEAARFKYWERELVTKGLASQPPTASMLSYVQNWEALSSKIQKADKDGKFSKPPVSLDNDDGSKRLEDKVSPKLRNDLAYMLAV